MGLARRHENAERRSFGSDSGSTISPNAKFARLNAAETQNGSRGLIEPSRPPNTGPVTNPTPKQIEISPNRAARFSGGVMSAIYAVADEKLAAVMPAMTRPTNSQARLGAAAISR